MGDKETYVKLENLIGGLDRLISYPQSEEEFISEDSLVNSIIKHNYEKSRIVVEMLKECINDDLPKYEFNKEEK